MMVLRLGDGSTVCEKHHRESYGDPPETGWQPGRCDYCRRVLVIHENDCNGEGEAFRDWVQRNHPDVEIEYKPGVSGVGSGLFDGLGNEVDHPNLWEDYCNA